MIYNDSIYAVATSGEIIELQKDCDCTNHDGPHWLYSNDRERWVSLELLSQYPTNPREWFKFCNRQITILTNRNQQMEQLNIRLLVYMPQKHWLEVCFNENHDSILVDTRTNIVLAAYKAKP